MMAAESLAESATSLAFPAAVEKTQTGFQEVREELSALAERASAVEERVRELEDGGAGDS